MILKVKLQAKLFRTYNGKHYILRTYSVDVGVIEDRRGETKKQKEIDSIVNNFDNKKYIQSVLRIEEDAKMNSELDSLKLTKDFLRR